jgi:hypothetical protein
MEKKTTVSLHDLEVRHDQKGGGWLRDKLVDAWDGVSGGLASVGWGEGGSIDTITKTLGG